MAVGYYKPKNQNIFSIHCVAIQLISFDKFMQCYKPLNFIQFHLKIPPKNKKQLSFLYRQYDFQQLPAPMILQKETAGVLFLLLKCFKIYRGVFEIIFLKSLTRQELKMSMMLQCNLAPLGKGQRCRDIASDKTPTRDGSLKMCC